MKLKFSIHYHTAWGERLHVVVGYHHQDGSCKQQNLAMQTDDGQQWTLETAVLVSLRHPLSHIEYYYQVESSEGEVLRREWRQVPRRYYFDATKDYQFPDQWRDRPLAYHLYTKAYRATVCNLREEEVEVARLPLFRRTILFRVSAPQLQAGQAVAVLGSHPAIGSWNITRYVEMQYVGQGEWMLSVDAMGWQMPIEYKYVVVDAKSHTLLAWEEGANRIISEGLTDGQVLVLYGELLRLCEQPWRLAGVSISASLLRGKNLQTDMRKWIDWAVLAGMKVVKVAGCPLSEDLKAVADYARQQGIVLMADWTPSQGLESKIPEGFDALCVRNLDEVSQESTALHRLSAMFEDSNVLFAVEDWSLLSGDVRSVLNLLRFVWLDARRIPVQLPVRQATEVVARHLASPSRLCILPLEDWLLLDGKMRRKHPTIAQLLESTSYNKRIKALIQHHKR